MLQTVQIPTVLFCDFTTKTLHKLGKGVTKNVYFPLTKKKKIRPLIVFNLVIDSLYQASVAQFKDERLEMHAFIRWTTFDHYVLISRITVDDN